VTRDYLLELCVLRRGAVARLGAIALAIWLAASGAVRAAEFPAEVLDLTHWKITLPAPGPESKHAREVEQPELAQFQDPASFFVASDTGGVVFRAACGGVTTKGSKYPRSELREMSGGDRETSWGTDDAGAHSLRATLAVTHLPARKPHVVCAQIHDAKADLIMVRVEGRKLLVERNKAEDVLLDADYSPGKFFELRIEAGGGHVRLWHNGEAKMDWERSRGGCYFKIGCYTQSNPDKGDAPEEFGEVVVRSLSVSGTR